MHYNDDKVEETNSRFVASNVANLLQRRKLHARCVACIAALQFPPFYNLQNVNFLVHEFTSRDTTLLTELRKFPATRIMKMTS